MATNAKFVADFSSFETAVQNAVVKLRDWEKSIKNVDRDLTNMASAFKGDRIFREATLAAKAVESIGGVSKLTASEQRRLNAVVGEAVEKYRALGEKAPKHLVDLEKATRKVEESTGGLSTKMIALGTAAGTFIGNIAASAVKALGRELVTLATNGIKLEPIVRSFEQLTASIGTTSDAMLTTTRTATKGLITDLNIMQSANKAILLGLPVTADAFGTLSAAAVTLGKAMGQDATKSLDDLITALGRSSPLILDNLGLTVKVGEANEQYAAQLHKSASELTDAEKKLAFYNAAVDAAKAKMEALGGVQLTVADQILRVKNQFTNFTDALGVAIARAPVLNAALASMADAMGEAFGGNQVAAVQRLIGIINTLSIGLVDAGQLGLAAAGYIRQGWGVLQLVFTSAQSVIYRVGVEFANLVAGAAELATKLPGLGNQFQGVAGSARDFATRLDGMQRSFHDQAVEALEAVKGHSAFQRTLDAASEKLSAMRARMVEASTAMVKESDIAADLVRKITDTGDAHNGAATAIDRFGQSAERATEQVAAFYATIGQDIARQGVQRKVAELQLPTADLKTNTSINGISIESIRKVLGSSKGPWSESADDANEAQGTLSKVFGTSGSGKGQMFQGLSETFARAWEGGGGVAGAAKSYATMVAKNALNLIPAVGPIISQFAGPLVAGVSKLFGGLFGGEGKKTNKERDSWVKELVGINDLPKAQEALRQMAKEAGIADVEMQRLFSTKKTKVFEDAAKRVSDQLKTFADEQAADTERLNAAIQKYGFSIEELGPKLQAQKLTEAAKELIEDWRVLAGAGIDVAAVNEKMAGSINEFLQTALAVGAEVPAAMRPILQSMVDQGTLFDANGNKIEDLEAAGVTFAETLTQGFDRVVQKLDELISRLGLAGNALEALPSSVDIGFNASNLPNFDSGGLPAEGYAGGTSGRYIDFGAGRAVTLHGRERVMTEAETSSDTSLADLADALRAYHRDLPRAMQIAFKNALALA